GGARRDHARLRALVGASRGERTADRRSAEGRRDLLGRSKTIVTLHAWIAGIAAVLFSASSFAQEGAPKKLTLADVVSIASRDSTPVRIADRSVEAAEQRVQASRAQLFPRLHADGNIFVWDKALEIALSADSSLTVRDQVTGSLNVTVA